MTTALHLRPSRPAGRRSHGVLGRAGVVRAAAAIAVFLTIAAVGAAAPPTPEPFTVTSLSERLHVIHGGSGFGANVGVCVGDEGLLVVDTMLDSSSERLAQAIASISDRPVEIVVNTHDHQDHAGGNPYFAERGAVIIAHEASRFGPALVHLRIPTRFQLDYCGEAITVHPVVAHTFGDLLILFETSNAVFVGDIFTNSYYPSGYADGRRSEFEAAGRILALADSETTIVPGHGRIDDATGVERARDRIGRWYERVAALRTDGATVAEMLRDVELRRLKNEFLGDRRGRLADDTRFERYLRRTLSADFVPAFPLTVDEIDATRGRFRSSDGLTLEIAVENQRVFLRQEGSFIEQLVPTGPDTFHIRGSVAGRVVLTRTDHGDIAGIAIEDGESVVSARKVE
jgi:cyclase